jgi:phage gpG-like protein
MSATITIQLSPSAIALADKFRRAPQEFPQAIKRGMTRALAIVAGRIQEKRLTGVGPFPVAEHRLGERTGQLKLRTRATDATVISEGDHATITGAIGSSVKYAAVHEFGFEGDVTVKAHNRRLYRRTSRAGKPLKKPKLKGSTEVRSYERHMSIPERAPFRTGIRENITYISDEIEKELVTSLKL